MTKAIILPHVFTKHHTILFNDVMNIDSQMNVFFALYITQVVS